MRPPRARKGTWYLFALLLLAARAAGAVGFTGRVTAEDGVTGLNGVTVQAITPVNDSVIYTAATGPMGYYTMPAPAGTYHVQVSRTGYFPSVRSSHTVTTGDIQVDFALQASGEVYWDDCSSNLWSQVSKPSAGSFTSVGGNVCDYFTDFPSNTADNVYDWFSRTGLNIPYANNFVTLRHRVQILSGAPLQGSLLFFNSWNWTGVLGWSSDTPWEELSYTLGSRTNNANLTELQFINDPNDFIPQPSQWHSYIDYLIVHSRDRGFVNGQVKNLGGTPLPYSRVQVHKGTAVVGEGLSDAAGNYTVWVATAPGGYSVYFSTNGTAEFRRDGVAVYGRSPSTVDIYIDTAPPAAVSTLGVGPVGADSVQLTWQAPGDDGYSGQLNASSFTIQHSTDPLQAWSPQAAQINIPIWGVNPFSGQVFTVNGLRANTTNYFRLWTRDAYGNFSALSNGATALTQIEAPQDVYFDEISSWSITASAYASTFTRLGDGASGVNIATGTGYGPWTAGGDAWSAGPDMGLARQGAAGAALGGRIYILGGTPDGINYSAAVEEYDPVMNTWTTRNPMLTQRSGLAAAVVGGRLYAIGGKNSGGVKNVNEEYDPATGLWTSRAPMPTPRDRLAAAALRGKVYAVGGAGVGDVVSDLNEAYDPATDTWQTRQPLPGPRRNLAAAATAERLYASGGYNFGPQQDLYRYDQWSDTWNQLPLMNKARFGHALAAIGSKLYVVAGYDGGVYISETETYDLKSGFWASAAPMISPREGAGNAALGGSVYLAGGYSGAYLKTAYKYDAGVSRVFKGLAPNRQYWFRAKARNQAGFETGETVYVSTYTLAVAAMPLPGQPPITGVGYSSMAVHWSSGTQLAGFNDFGARYEVQVATSPDFRGYETRWMSATETSAVIDSLRGNTTYYVRVQAFNTGGYTDNSWTLLGSTRTLVEPLGGAIVSTVTAQLEAMNPQRRAVRDSRGDLYAAYYKLYAGKYRVFLARSTDNGGSWADTTAFPVETAGDYPAANSYSQGNGISLAIDSRDVLHLVWGGVNSALDSSGPESKCVYSSAPVPGVMWSPHVKIPAHVYEGGEAGFTIAADGNDGLHVVWVGQDCGVGPDCYQLRYSSRAAADGSWKAWEAVNPEGKFYGAPALAIDSKNAAHLVVRHAAVSGSWDTPQVLYSSRSAGGWNPWTTVHDAGAFSQGDPSLTIDVNGRLFAAWAGPDSTYSNPQIKYAVRPPAGSWSAMGYAGPEAAAPQRYPAAAADAIGKVYVLWSGSDTVNSAVNLKGGEYDGSTWKPIDKLSDEAVGQQLYPSLRWSGWRNNGGGIDVLWNTYDGASSTSVLRHMQGPDVPMSAGWTKTAWAKPAECAYAINVRQDDTADFPGIQQALAALPAEISAPSCVVVRDTGTYSEQVRVEGYRIRTWDSPASRIFIMADPTFVSSAPVVIPPQGSLAAFRLATDSVTVQGITIVSTNSVSYGVLASSAHARVSSMTITGGSYISLAGVYISSYGVVSYSSVAVQNAAGIRVSGPYFAVAGSTVTSASAGNSALEMLYSGNGSVTDSYFYNTAGPAAYSDSSDQLLMARSVALSTASTQSALNVYRSRFNTIADSRITSLGGGALWVNHAQDLLLQRSTVTSSGSSYQYGLDIYGATVTVTDSFVQGSTAVYAGSSGVLIVRGSVIKSTWTGGVGLNLAYSHRGVFVATSTVSGGPQGHAMILGPNNNGKIELASSTIAGGSYGLTFSQQAGASLVISSLTFRSLSPGATAINFLSGVYVADIDRAVFDSTNIAVNVNGEGLTGVSLVNMPAASGPRFGARYERDPASYVRWDPVTAALAGPPGGASALSPARPLYAAAPAAASPVQYYYQVSDLPGMAPSQDFDQRVNQAYDPKGAFSGQDGTVSYPGDSFLNTSTAAFVFYSTSTQLQAGTTYYWRVKAYTADAGDYGPWTAVSTFTVGEPATITPVNNLLASQVTLSSPSAAGMRIDFLLRENNVSTGTTPNGAAYNTADWIFVKFSTQAGADGSWNHATLTGGSVSGGGALAVAADGRGAFLDHAVMAPLWVSSVTLNWDYAADGAAGARASVKVFAISMVKVPGGSFVYNVGGAGGSGSNNFGGGAQATVSGPSQLPSGAPLNWPNGYNSFYIMRYEITQGQYADFLNTVHSSTASALHYGAASYGHNILFNGANPYGMRYWAEDRFAAKNYLSTADLWSYLSWAALRPMTEMEYEKACRDVDGDAREYPWGNSAPDGVTYTSVNEGAVASRNFMNYNSPGGRVLDVGRYLSGDIFRTAEQTGASPYGIADLAGNVWEYAINCSYLSVPAGGNGTTAWPAGWPSPTSSQKGLRGGGWADIASYARVSSRYLADWAPNSRNYDIGGRGGRTP